MIQRDLTPYEATQLARHSMSAEMVVDPYKPIEYYTGVVDFLGLELSVTPDVLIPRIETEELVEKVLSIIVKQQKKTPLTIADVGTGSGAIAVTLSWLLSEKDITHRITATDISPAALAVAQKNAASILENSPAIISFSQEHLLSQETNPFDYIVANLPYIPSTRIATLPKSVIDYEPHMALDGGPDGMALITELINQATQLLVSDGTLFLEVDDTHTSQLWETHRQNWNVEILTDIFGKNRFALLTKKL